MSTGKMTPVLIGLGMALLSLSAAVSSAERAEVCPDIPLVEEVPTQEHRAAPEAPDGYQIPVPEIPLDEETQRDLFEACEEFNLAPPILLAIIENETDFRNIYGDEGDSAGYCQIQEKWHRETMERIGAHDLFVPRDNFRTACAILIGLYERYGEGNTDHVLTAYNRGSFDGVVTGYAEETLSLADKWEAVLGGESVMG